MTFATSNFPEPPLPADLDLSTLEYMPLLIVKLRRSKAWLRAKRRPELGFYMLNLWMAAWMETPAASMEDDDDVLADAAMCPPDIWDDVRDLVLHGFYKCSDGRLYHATLVEQAMITLEKRLKWRSKKKDQRGKVPEVSPETGDGRDAEGEAVRGENADVSGDGVGKTAKIARDKPLRDGTGRDVKEDIEIPPRPTFTAAAPGDGPMGNYSPEAQQAVDDFERIRLEVFPRESGLPASRMTLATQAQRWLDEGFDPPSLAEAVLEGMHWYLNHKRPTPKSFDQFKESLPRIAEKRREAAAAVAPEIRVGHRDADAWPAWAQGYRDHEFWSANRGDFPGSMPPNWTAYALRQTDARPDGKPDPARARDGSAAA